MLQVFLRGKVARSYYVNYEIDPVIPKPAEGSDITVMHKKVLKPSNI